MRVNLLARLKKLDATFVPNKPAPTFRCGWLTTLPEDFTGERHIVVVSRPPDNSPEEPWEFAEQAGRGPTEPWENSFTVYLTR
jgi:hypothetical protein